MRNETNILNDEEEDFLEQGIDEFLPSAQTTEDCNDDGEEGNVD